VRAYDGLDRLTEETGPLGRIGYRYDAADRLSAIAYRHHGNPLGDLTYGYDANGQIVAQGGSLAARTLPQALAAARHDANHRLAERDGTPLSYDANGNLLHDGTRSYTWDARGRLTEIRQGTATLARYSYDALDRRTRKSIGAAVTQYRYDGGNPVQELNGSGGLRDELLTGLGVDEVLVRTRGTTAYTYLRDHLGSTLALALDDGTLAARYTYDPHGETTRSGSDGGNPFQYTGRENDGIGLYYYRPRYYDPRLQRFISEDPIGLAGGLNTYAYVQSNPLTYVDPLGLMGYPDGASVRPLPCPYPPVPKGPPEASCDTNINTARNHQDPSWFYNQVRNGGPWDYKQQGHQYQDFGNFNFGATGSAFGFPDSVLSRAAGWAQQQAGTSSPNWGHCYGSHPYGDDPDDQVQIQGLDHKPAHPRQAATANGVR
jgi:RHS repeat-associated protein